MDKFRDVYREACRELPSPSMDAAKVRDDLRHHRRMRQRRRYLITRGCAAAAVFLLCGAGTAAAKYYRSSVIELSDTGFVVTRQQDEREQTKNRMILDDASDQGPFLKMGGVFTIEEDIPETMCIGFDAERNGPEAAEKELLMQSPKEAYFREYSSIEEFKAAEGAVAVTPDKTLFDEEFTLESVQVIDRGAQIILLLSNEDVSFSLRQSNHRDAESYSSCTSYGELSANKRNFVSRQGLSYVVFDSVDEAGDVLSTHGVISINDWDLEVSFAGFEEGIVEKVLDALDLSMYFNDEKEIP